MFGVPVVLDDDDDGEGDDGMCVVECDDGGVWGPRRGHSECVLWTVILLLWNLMLLMMCAVLLLLVFSVVLLPAALLLYTGFLCHSRVVASTARLCRYLDDNSSSALTILGFVMMSPLVVVAAALFCALLRRLHIFLYFQPITGARHHGRGLCWRRDVRVWV
ncbi:transmembrane protein 88B [Triplophysa dalaica]|uniref:transmembrane protein 88B n=1 Tax=Triplophysa dalaica TaxID=1582913 RepID=UPI0024DFC951|nr:transmembrane protein 88B [Triplophysa dalaica]